MGLLGRGAGDDEQPDGATQRDRRVPGDLAQGRALPGAVHQRFAVSDEGHERVGVRLDGPWLEEEGRADTESRIVDRGGRVGPNAPGELAVGAGARGTSTERVRESSGDASRPRADKLRRNRVITVR